LRDVIALLPTQGKVNDGRYLLSLVVAANHVTPESQTVAEAAAARSSSLADIITELKTRTDI
jgi:hypothetical protein